MENQLNQKLSTVLFIPHGGGPLPLLGDKNHQTMVDFLQEITSQIVRPSAIIVISAHWEADKVTVTSGKKPTLIYDYSGFPEEAYKIEYPAPGNPELAKKIVNLLKDNSIDAKLDEQRGFDHGLFVPLKIMFPDANIPCVQLSLLNSLDPTSHIQIGKALADLRKENILIIGSGFTFHNMKAIFAKKIEEADRKNEIFEDWLIDTCTNYSLSPKEREQKLIHWSETDHAEYCHPREEHLLPLHVCYGFTNTAAKLVFDGKIVGIKTSAFLWQE